MNKYEAMVIVKPDLPEEGRKNLFTQINDVIVKNGGTVARSSVWSERRKMCFPIKKCQEGVYYLLDFTVLPAAITKIRLAFTLNEDILRVLVLNLE